MLQKGAYNINNNIMQNSFLYSKPCFLLLGCTRFSVPSPPFQSEINTTNAPIQSKLCLWITEIVMINFISKRIVNYIHFAQQSGPAAPHANQSNTVLQLVHDKKPDVHLKIWKVFDWKLNPILKQLLRSVVGKCERLRNRFRFVSARLNRSPWSGYHRWNDGNVSTFTHTGDWLGALVCRWCVRQKES